MTRDKTVLRLAARERRDELAAAQPNAGATLALLFPTTLPLDVGSVVAGYVPFRGEIDPRPLLAALAARGALTALPVTPPRGSDAPLSFRLWSEAEPLAPGSFGVHEPHGSAALVEPDLLLVPLLAFDRYGGRLGYGAGHYDRTLSRLRALKPVWAIGLAFAGQQIARVPSEAHDQPLDGVLTEAGYLPAQPPEHGIA